MTEREWSWTNTRFHLSWPALFGGLFAAAGMWLLAMLLGSAVAVSSLDATDGDGARAIGVGAGVWWVLASIAALAVGGLVTTRCAGVIGSSHAALHGIVLWGLATTVTLVITLGMANSLAAGVASLNPMGAVRGGVGSMTRTLDVDANDFLDPINARLQQSGRSTVTVRELQAAVDDALETAIARGRYDFDTFVSALARNTGIDRRELADALATTRAELQTRIDSLADRTADAAQVVLWSIFAMMALSLGAALIGAIAGLSREQRELASRPPPAPTLDPATSAAPR
jgi:hypothetical protein